MIKKYVQRFLKTSQGLRLVWKRCLCFKTDLIILIDRNEVHV